MTIKAHNAVAKISWPQDQRVPLKGRYLIYRDNADGEVDYDHHVASVPAWPDGAGKTGWGLGGWGLAPWGLDGPGLGWGLGGWGLGGWGIGAEMLSAAVGPLADGTYTFAVCGADAAGNVLTPATVTAEAELAGTPAAPTDAEATGYDAEAPSLTLSWTLSEDDET